MTNSDRGREGVKNHENLADVICTCPLMKLRNGRPRLSNLELALICNEYNANIFVDA